MKALKCHVERVVRPIRASDFRKDRMREELLTHLSRLHAEEHARGCDEPTAVATAIRRFGDAGELSRELQASVPLIERWLWLRFPGTSKWGRRSGEPQESFLVRSLRWQIGLNALAWIPAIVFAILFAGVGSRWTWAGPVLLEALALQLVQVGCVLLCELIRRELYGAGERPPASRRRVGLLVAAYTALCMGVGGGFMATTLILLEHLHCPVARGAWIWGAPVLMALVTVPLLHIAAWQSAITVRRFEEWGTLDLGAE